MFSIGCYNQADRESVLDRLDPWTKLVILFGFFGVVFFYPSPGILLCTGISLVLSAKVGKISIGYLIHRLKFLLWFFIFGNLFYFFFTPGRILYQIPGLGLTVTQEGVRKGLTLIAQLCLMATASFLLLGTTSTVKLIKCVQCIFYPLYRLGIAVPDITLMMVMSLRFIPVLLSEGKRITQIQMSRAGYAGEEGLIGYAKNLVPLISPIFLSTVRKAQILALAIEQRGYTGEVSRQHFYFPRLHRRDVAALVLAGLFLAGLILRQQQAGYIVRPGW
ncbi:MAG: energy-coupling factor transporter transmembrane component T [bacterium]